MMTRYPTIEELARMDAQAVFNHVARHLLAQGAPSTSRTTEDRLYRGQGGRACAIGSVIPDSVYSAAFEHNRIPGLLMRLDTPEFRTERHETFAAFLLAHAALLTGLMDVHDLAPPRLWPSALRTLAAMFGLSTAAIDRIDGREADVERSLQDEPATPELLEEMCDVLA
ncbi:hypothetical protein [Paraburkholderia sp. 35.1]|uniref:hypothetical protein n=1 Tax=Paraburkholderia sp. 35.1 TaxID=2991058 RepID=UPI003D1D8313